MEVQGCYWTSWPLHPMRLGQGLAQATCYWITICWRTSWSYLLQRRKIKPIYSIKTYSIFTVIKIVDWYLFHLDLIFRPLSSHIKNAPMWDVLLWRSQLRIWSCCSCGAGHNCSAGLIPSLGTSTCCECSQKEKRKKKNTCMSNGDFAFFLVMLMIIFHAGEKKSHHGAVKITKLLHMHTFFPIQIQENKITMRIFNSICLTLISCGFGSVIWYSLEMSFFSKSNFSYKKY